MNINHEPTTDAPTYTLARSSAGHEAIWTNGMELNNSAVVAHLNSQAIEIARLNRVIDNNMRGLLNAARDVDKMEGTIAELRGQLDEARGHVEATKKELEIAIEWIQERGTTAAKYAPTAEEIVPQLFAAASAARAFLRRA